MVTKYILLTQVGRCIKITNCPFHSDAGLGVLDVIWKPRKIFYKNNFIIFIIFTKRKPEIQIILFSLVSCVTSAINTSYENFPSHQCSFQSPVQSYEMQIFTPIICIRYLQLTEVKLYKDT